MAFLNPKDCKPDKVYTANGVEVYEYLLKNHNINNISLPSKRKSSKVRITIHNTDDLPSIEDDGRNYTAATINDNMKSVRVHFYVDDLRAWQNLELDSQNWSCADGNGNGNATTIAIECIMRNSYDTESLKSMDNCARLTAYLCVKYNLTTDDVYTHTYWLHMRDKDSVSKCGDKDKICTTRHNYKTCPIYIIPQWDKFLALVNKYIAEMGGKVVVKPSTPSTSTPPTSTSISLPYKVKVKIDSLNVRADAGVNNKITCTIRKNEVYTIIEEKKIKNSDGSIAIWGRLKSKIGWVNVGDKYVTKVK